MPIPCMAAGAFVAGLAGATGCPDCEANDDAKSVIVDNDEIPAIASAQYSPASRVDSVEVASTAGSEGRALTKSVQFADTENSGKQDDSTGSVPPTQRPSSTQSIRSIEADQILRNSFHTKQGTATSSIYLQKAKSEHALNQGFTDGNFASGKVHDLIVDKCFVMAYLRPSVELLAVGLSTSVGFYETSGYSLVYSLQQSDMVSDIQWLPVESSESVSSLLAVGNLDGTVALYRVNVALLEHSGPTKIHEFRVRGQARALGCAFFGKLHPSLLLAIGDKTGRVTFTSFSESLEHIETKVVQQHPMGVLGISIYSKRGLIASSTKAGHVGVHSLRRDSSAAVRFEGRVWHTERSGPVRCVLFSEDGKILALGGYDMTVALVDAELWAITRELRLQGTINSISFDPHDRYLAIGCRDMSLTLFDTSTYVPVKTFYAQGWITSISWGLFDDKRDIVAVRSERNCVSILSLNPIRQLSTRLSSHSGMEESSLSWNYDGTLVARAVHTHVVVAEAASDFMDIASVKLGGIIYAVSFCRSPNRSNLIAAVDSKGRLTVLRLQTEEKQILLETVHSIQVEGHLKALSWSRDGELLATGGREKYLHVFSTESMKRPFDPIEMPSRIWDIEFMPEPVVSKSSFVAVGLGDYTAVVFNGAFEPSLQISRSRTVRCLCCHPTIPLLAVGDGAGTVAIVDYDKEEVINELDVGSRVSSVEFSPMGDYLAVATDDCLCTLHETAGYQCVQEVECEGFALVATFAPNGAYLAIGTASESYKLVHLGPFLGLDLLPTQIEDLPSWALNEALYRSSDGPSYIQRLMTTGSPEIYETLRHYPDAIYAFNRKTGKGCFDTVLHLKKPNLLRLAVTTLVDGTLDASKKSLLTTNIPSQGATILADIVERYPPEFAVDIFKKMSFLRVPFTEPRVVNRGDRCDRGSDSYMDPHERQKTAPVRSLHRNSRKWEIDSDARKEITRTPVVLPLPGLGEMEFLSSLLANAPPSVFDNEAMALVLRVMWGDHIRLFFLLDFFLFLSLFGCWVGFVEWTASSDAPLSIKQISVSMIIIVLNSLFASKEIVQSRCGRRPSYFRSLWNAIDVLSFVLVYAYIVECFFRGLGGDGLVPLAVLTTLLLTTKLLFYLRGFADTGWLISVLAANFRDVRGFLVIVFIILMGFAITFRLLFGNSGTAGFGSLRRSFLSTFELTIIGSYEEDLLYDTRYSFLSAMIFVLAVTCVLVVALNALISILADSYARVQENATANRRKEQAELVVEYLSLLPPWKRRKIEDSTKWFHTLLEVDADGDLLISSDEWVGNLNALRRDIEQISNNIQESNRKSLEKIKADLDADLSSFKREVLGILRDLSEDVRKVQKVQSEGGITFTGRNVHAAVKMVKSIGRKGSSLFAHDRR